MASSWKQRAVRVDWGLSSTKERALAGSRVKNLKTGGFGWSKISLPACRC